MGFEKASEDSELNRVVDKTVRIMGRCYEDVKEFLDKEPEGKEINMVITTFIHANKKLDTEEGEDNWQEKPISPSQENYLRDLIEKGVISDKFEDEMEDMTRGEASKLIEKAKQREERGGY